MVAVTGGIRVPPRVWEVWDVLDGNLECKGLCQESCGPWVCSKAEGAVLNRIAGKPVPDSMRCPFLGQSGECTVHDVRPLVCRLWGQVESLPCRFGCKPRRMLSDAEGEALVEALGDADWSPWPMVESYHKQLNEIAAKGKRRTRAEQA